MHVRERCGKFHLRITHAKVVLAEVLGFSADEIAALRAEGVV